jgi:hypothetical protein
MFLDLGDRPIDTRTYVLFDTVAAFHTGAPAVLMAYSLISGIRNATLPITIES